MMIRYAFERLALVMGGKEDLQNILPPPRLSPID